MDGKGDRSRRKGQREGRGCVCPGGCLRVHYTEWGEEEGRVAHGTIRKAIPEGQLCFLIWLSGEGQSREGKIPVFPFNSQLIAFHFLFPSLKKKKKKVIVILLTVK